MMLVQSEADWQTIVAAIQRGDVNTLKRFLKDRQWRAARRLIERGAIPNLWQAAALGLLDAVERLSAAGHAARAVSRDVSPMGLTHRQPRTYDEPEFLDRFLAVEHWSIIHLS